MVRLHTIQVGSRVLNNSKLLGAQSSSGRPAIVGDLPSKHVFSPTEPPVEGSKAHWATKAAVRFLALTANRPGAVRGARWDEIDLAKAIWTIPANRAKNREAFKVPLSHQALSVLYKAREHTGGVGLVFPSRRGLPISDSTMSKLFRENRIGSVPYGICSTFRVWCAEVGVPRQVAEACMEHICDGVRPAQAPVEPRRQVMEAWGQDLFPNVPPR